jgi:uncharacterized protein YqfA (UPF0365 family)
MPLDSQQIFAIAFCLVVLVICLCMFVVFASIFRIWLQAFMAGVHISLPEILGMKFRKVDPNTVVRTAIMVNQAGTPVPSVELERAYLQGVDIEKVALAFIDTQKRGKKVSFQDLVDAELHQRLEEKLKG